MVIYHLKVKKKFFICIDLDRKYGGDWVTGWAKVRHKILENELFDRSKDIFQTQAIQST